MFINNYCIIIILCDNWAIAVHNGKYCGKKNLNDYKIEVTEYNGICEIDPELLVKDVDSTCFTFDEATGTITGYDSSCGDSIRIPSQINGITVSKIGDEAFHTNRLEKLYLPDSITSMGEWVFAENQITELKLPNNIQSMESCIFERNFIKEINIPASLKVIPDHSFGCNKLTKITFNEGLEEIESNAFWNYYTNEIVLPSSLKRLNTLAFHWGETKKVIIKGKDSSADFEYYGSMYNPIFGWADGYDDSNIIYEGK